MAQADYPVNISQLNRNFYTFKLSRIPTTTFFLQKVSLPGIISPNFDQPTTVGVPVKRPLGTYNFANRFQVVTFLTSSKHLYDKGLIQCNCIIDLVNKYPNNFDLGAAIRNLVS